jgi:DNA-binding GntR family transcriptional regulator
MPESPFPRRVTQQSIVDQVLDEVRRAILDGSLAAGSALSIAELSERLDVSHIPVREAMRRLEGEGLIELRRGRSAVVAPLSTEDLTDVFGMRAVLEADVMARAVELYSDSNVEVLEAAWEALEVRPDDTADQLSARHAAFHQLLLRPAATEWASRLLDLVWQAGERYMYLVFAEALDSPPGRLRHEHAPLLEAARQRDPDAVRIAVREHLDLGVRRAEPLLERRQHDL